MIWRKAWMPLILLLALWNVPAMAAGSDDLFLIRSQQSYPEAMATLQDALRAQGYTVSRVQHVDKGLVNRGYASDAYKVVFFGRGEEVQQITASHPELIPYLPLQVVIFAEEEQTLLIAERPRLLGNLFPNSGLSATFQRWDDELQQAMDQVREAH